MTPRKTLTQAVYDELDEERVRGIKRNTLLITILSAIAFVGFVTAIYVGLSRQAVVDCYKWQRYDRNYAGFEVSKDMAAHCNELGVEIKADDSVEMDTTTIRFNTFEPEYIEIKLVQHGVASWYNYELDGSPDHSKYHSTCASRDWPRYSKVLVTRVDTGKSVVCYVNDYIEHPDRVIDLSSYAFSQLAPLGLGLIEVKIQMYDEYLSTSKQ